jgi:ribosomal protein S18 acetylase RimI-like enzyme
VPVTVAVVAAADAEELHAALQRLVPQLSRSNPPPGLDAVREMLAHDAITQFVARSDDGRIVGVATLAAFPIPTATRAWVEDVVVDEASSNQGIGRLLVDAMVVRARELGARTVDLTSRPSREAANHLYRKAGFEVRDTNVYRRELSEQRFRRARR